MEQIHDGWFRKGDAESCDLGCDMNQKHHSGFFWHGKEANVVSINICVACKIQNVLHSAQCYQGLRCSDMSRPLASTLQRKYGLPGDFLEERNWSDHWF